MSFASISGHKIGIRRGYIVVRCRSGKTFNRQVKTVLKDTEFLCSVCRHMMDYDAIVGAVLEATGVVYESFASD